MSDRTAKPSGKKKPVGKKSDTPKAETSQTSSVDPGKMVAGAAIAAVKKPADKQDVTSGLPNRNSSCSETQIGTQGHVGVVTKCESDCQKEVPKDGQQPEGATCVDGESSVVVAAKSKAELKAERRALQEAQRAAKNAESKSTSSKPSVGGVSTEKIVSAESNDASSTAGKSKSELRAERRAIQEAQRATKAAGKTIKANSSTGTSGGQKQAKVKEVKPTVNAKRDGIITVATTPKELTVASKTTKQIKLFSHLPPYKRDVSVLQAVNDGIHPAIVQLGLKYAAGIICGSNARCVALIVALQKVIRDFKTPKNKEISHALPEMILEPSMNFLENCRPVSVGMKNVAKKLREEIVNLEKHLSEDEAKEQLNDVLETFRTEQIEKAHEAIVNLAKDKITGNDVILTYGSSDVVKEVLITAHRNAEFRVIVVDSRPKLEGRKMFEYLIREGVKCSYILINAVSYAMQEATKVLLGAQALLANGYVMSRVGSSQVALVAKASNKPVLVCCETYKFCDMVQTDSFVVNELGDPNDLVATSGRTNPLEGWVDVPKLNILNPYYDVTPPDLITVVINDVCLVPCTSVPVLLRVRPTRK